jgi:hypothetical protein
MRGAHHQKVYNYFFKEHCPPSRRASKYVTKNGKELMVEIREECLSIFPLVANLIEEWLGWHDFRSNHQQVIDEVIKSLLMKSLLVRVTKY